MAFRWGPAINEPKTASPTKRSLRSAEQVKYQSIQRAKQKDTLEVGDAVIIPRKNFDNPLIKSPEWKSPKFTKRGVPELYWKHHDGLKYDEQVGIITSLYERGGVEMCGIRWLIRPSSIYKTLEDIVDAVKKTSEENELYFSKDSGSLQDTDKEALNISQVPIAALGIKVKVLSSKEWKNDMGASGCFLVRKMYDLRPGPDDDFLSSVRGDEILKAIERESHKTTVKKKAPVHSEVESSTDDDKEESDIQETDESESDDDAGIATDASSKHTPRAKPSRIQHKGRSRITKRKIIPQIKRPLSALPPAFTQNAEFKTMNKFEKAKAVLHVSSTPENLPCRDTQWDQIATIVGSAISTKQGTCMYIHGVPGTGKTATVHSVIRALKESPDLAFEFIEINGMKIAEPATAFTMLWEAFSGTKLSPNRALDQLEAHFQTPNPTRPTTVVLVDELDQMLTKKQDVVYNIFNWPNMPHSRLIVIAIANTMDLPERELSGKIKSRLGMQRILFPTYTWQELVEIIKGRLVGIEVFEPTAIQRIAAAVAKVSGDARRALDMARRTVEKRDLENQSSGESPICNIDDAGETIREMGGSGSNKLLEQTSLYERIFLLALAQRSRTTGLADVEMESVMAWYYEYMKNMRNLRAPSHEELFALATGLAATRIIWAETQRMDYMQRVRLLVDVGEVFAILEEDTMLKGSVVKIKSRG